MRTKAISKVWRTIGKISTAKLFTIAALATALALAHPALGQTATAADGRPCSANSKFDLLITVVFDGNLVRENFRVADVYVVNSDCTGILGSGFQGPSFDILVVRDGSSFLLIDKNPGGTGASEVKPVK
jgi:hypothetical protein